jgi:two-component system, sensor histidine kinase and response regulator
MEPLKVLVVDDEPGIRSGIERVLRGFSVSFPFLDTDFTYELIPVETGEEAVEIIDNQKIDIILLDNKLPGIQGIEVLEYINKNQIDVEVMMITSYANLDLAVRATNQGAFNFVPKPFTPQELRTAIEAITKHLYLKGIGKNLNKTEKQNRFQFLSVLSHELKSPINAVEGYLNIMNDKQMGEDLNTYMNMIERSLIRIKGMRNLIMDMLDITRLESGIKRREIRPIDLVEIAKISKDTVEPLAIQKNIKIHLDLPDELFFKADYNEMEIVINNLLSNAVKYNKENGKVFLTVSKVTSGIKIVVDDTGIGIDKNDIPKLFGEFERIKNEKTREISGTGLGLNIVKKIIDMYRGSVHVESEPDKGTKFTVIINS